MARARIVRIFVRAVLSLVGLLVAAVLAWAFSSRNLPDLKLWHTVDLPSQFTADEIDAMSGLEDYLAREDKLFAEVQTYVYDRIAASDQLDFNRYQRGSATDPTRWPQDYNRSYQLEPSTAPRCGALMVHGLSDSPYSMRTLAGLFQQSGCYVLALRMPGHGTIPGGLLHAGWDDWRAAVALGAAAVRTRIGESVPLLLVGYSNGGALTLGHALAALDDKELVPADALMLFSPMIGVTPLSRLADLGNRLTALSYFEKFAWLDVLPEYDPYKYNSFTKNAGYQTFLITRELRERLRALEAADRLAEIPPVLAFQSLVDATVSMPAVVDELFGRLRTPGSDLVLFDLNRTSSLAPFLKLDHRQFVENLLAGPALGYDLTLIGNLDSDSPAVVERRRRPGSDEIEKQTLDVSWPDSVYSLSHLAIVFPPDDPFYGTEEASMAAGVLNLGSITLRGEKGVTSVPVANFVRMRHNPFFDYLADRVRADLETFIAR